MHDALAIPELLQLYFRHLSCSDLTNAARVCSRWTEFALDRKWSAFRVNIVDLLKLLSTVWIINLHGVPHWSLQLLDNCDTRWNHLITYSQKVTLLHVGISPLLTTTIGALERLSEAHRTPIFGHVRRLDVELCEYGMNTTQFVLHSSLREVYIRTDQTVTAVSFNDLLSNLAEVSPHLGRLTITHASQFHFDPPELSGFKALEVLDYQRGPFSYDAWVALAELPRLRQLFLREIGIPTSPSITESRRSLRMPSLEGVSLALQKSHQQQFVKVVLLSTSMPALVSVRVEGVHLGREDIDILSASFKRNSPFVESMSFY